MIVGKEFTMENDFFAIEKYIILQGDRVFIDICKSGCGSSCKYCYSPYRNDAQELLSLEEIKHICRWIEQKYMGRIRIISLCPNTEPLKSFNSACLVLYIVEFFTKLSCKIQISTKEKLDVDFLEKLNRISKNNVFINISIPLIERSKNIEPYAASVEERFENFKSLKRFNKILSCLYIKPFFSYIDDYQKYIEYINKLDINCVCVGFNFLNKADIPCVSLYNEDVALQNFNLQKDEMLNFISLVRKETRAKVFASSVCYIYHCNDEGCPLSLHKYSGLLCEDCILEMVSYENNK